MLDRLLRAVRRALRGDRPPEGDDRYRQAWNAAAAIDARTAILTPQAGGVSTEPAFDETGRQDAAWLRTLAPPDAVVLDVGCGIGRIERHLAPHVARLHAVDVSDTMLAAAARRMAGQTNVVLHRTSATDLSPVPTASVDLVFSFLVLQHLDHEDAFRALREIARVLKAGGRAALQFPSLASPVYAAEFARHADTVDRSPARVRPYMPDLVERLLDLAGLRVEQFETPPGGCLTGDEIVVLACRRPDPPEVRDFRVRPLTPEVAGSRVEWAITATVTDANRDVAGGRAVVRLEPDGLELVATLDASLLAGTTLGLRLRLDDAPPGRLDVTLCVEDAVGVSSSPIAFYLTLAAEATTSRAGHRPVSHLSAPDGHVVAPSRGPGS